MTALQELLAKIEGPRSKKTPVVWFMEDAKELDWSILLLARAYNGSLDAARSMHEIHLPGWAVNGLDQASNLAGAPWGCEVAYFNGSNPNENKKAYSGHQYDNNPARAWLIAILKALIAEAGE